MEPVNLRVILAFRANGQSALVTHIPVHKSYISLSLGYGSLIWGLWKSDSWLMEVRFGGLWKSDFLFGGV